MTQDAAAVVLAVRGLGRGGAERLVFREAEAIKESGMPVEVWYQVPGEFVADLADLGVPSQTVTIASARRQLRRLLSTHGRVVVHTHSPSLGAMLRFAATGLADARFIHTEHNLVSSYRPGTRLAHRLTARRMDHLSAVSHAVLDSAPTVASRDVIYHSDLSTDRMQACLELPFKESGPLRLLCVASLTPKKDHANLLRAMERVDTDRLGPVWLGIVGDGPTAGEVHALAEQVGAAPPELTIELLGVRDDVPALLAEADALVLPSRSEGLPLIVMEAMAASTPVIATAVGGVPELLDSGAGVLVPAEDHEALAAAVNDVLADRARRRSLALDARDVVIDLTSTAWTEHYLRLIAELAAGRQPIGHPQT